MLATHRAAGVGTAEVAQRRDYLVAGWSSVRHGERKEEACSSGVPAMRRPRKPAPPTTEAIDALCAAFDNLFGRYEERRAPRQYLMGLLYWAAITARAQ
jgi:hypothetical protein